MTIKIKIPRLDIEADQEPAAPLTRWQRIKRAARTILGWLIVLIAFASIAIHSLLLTGNVRHLFFIALGVNMIWFACKMMERKK